MKIFSESYFRLLTDEARTSSRKRQHRNIHLSYSEPCQRLFNAIELGSYIRPHRHLADPRDELLIAVRGVMALVIFDEKGGVICIQRLGTERCAANLAVGAEVPASTWHTVVALEPSCILLEVKAGPFDPTKPKDFAAWAPAEGTTAADDYLNKLIKRINDS